MKTSNLSTFLLRHKYWLYLLYVPIYLIGFVLLEEYIDGSNSYWVSYTPLDDFIPFVDWFIIFYNLWYPFMLVVGVYLLIKEKHAYERMIFMLIIGFTIGLMICLVLPNGQNLRPDSLEKENMFTIMIKNLWRMDTNTNVFPSMHVYGSLMTMFAVLDSKTIKNKWVRLIVISLGLMICASTVLLKQHSILDLFASCILFCILYWIIYYNKIFNNYYGAVEYKKEWRKGVLIYKCFVK